MPKVSTIGLVNKVRVTNGSTQVADDDTFITAGPTWAGGTVTLPGPTSAPNNLPNNGDFYSVGDPIGKIDGGDHMVINGGGFPIQGGASVSLAVPFSEATFTFDDVNQAWIACICLGPLD
jgi:hypothetical protein